MIAITTSNYDQHEGARVSTVVVGRLTGSAPALFALAASTVYVARIQAAPYCESPTWNHPAY